VTRAADFGPLVINTDVDMRVIQELSLWLPTYQKKMELERGLDHKTLTRPEETSYVNALDEDEFPEHTLPAVIVTTANTEGEPQKDGEGVYSVPWNVVVSCVVRGRTPSETRSLAAMFEGCVRRIMTRNDPPPFDGEVRWTGSNTAAVADPSGAGRYLAAGIGTYLVYIDAVLKEGSGPVASDDSPYDPPTPGTDPDTPYGEPVKVGSVSTEVQGTSPTGLGG
jgi:hypothetical protein